MGVSTRTKNSTYARIGLYRILNRQLPRAAVKLGLDL